MGGRVGADEILEGIIEVGNGMKRFETSTFVSVEKWSKYDQRGNDGWIRGVGGRAGDLGDDGGTDVGYDVVAVCPVGTVG